MSLLFECRVTGEEVRERGGGCCISTGIRREKERVFLLGLVCEKKERLNI